VDLSEFKLDEADIQALAQIPDSPPAIAILKVAKLMYEKESRKLMEGTVGVSDTEPKKDFRHGIGAASTAAKILELHKEAKKLTA
jgi:hypothetical protein